MAERGTPPPFEGHEVVSTKVDILGRSDAIAGWRATKGGDTQAVFVVRGRVLKVGHEFQQQGCIRVEKFQLSQILEVEDEVQAKELIGQLEESVAYEESQKRAAAEAKAGIQHLDGTE